MSSRIDFPELTHLPEGSFVVGGAVRDSLLGRAPVDIDLATRNAEDVARRFAASTGGTLVSLGRERFATWRVVVGDRIYDFNDIIGDSIEQDLRRRDFTVNAMATELPGGRLIDPFGGRADLEERRLRMIDEGNFRDDPLRVLKGIRMSMVYEMEIEPETLRAMASNAGAVPKVAAERVAAELDQIVGSPGRDGGITLMNEIGLDILPQRKVGREPDLIAAWSMILGDVDAVERFSRRWKWSERQRKSVVAVLDVIAKIDTTDPRLLVHDYGREAARRAVVILGDRAAGLDEAVRDYRPVEALLTGDEIQEIAGIKGGPEVGRLKRAVLEAQLRNEIATREEAAALVKRLA